MIPQSEIQEAARPFTQKYNVHEQDFLFDYIVKQFGQKTGVRAYFEGGRYDAIGALKALERAKPKAGSLRVLEFASGYGRIARHSETVFSNHSYTCSDIHAQACEFISSVLGVRALPSSVDPTRLAFDEKWDFIFVFSLFSHLPDRTFGPWLKALYERLDCGGALMFTTHGEFALRKHPDHFGKILDPKKGCGFVTQSDQPDLDANEYGTMVVTMPYVIDMIGQHCENAHIKFFESGSWFGLQDEWIIIKPSSK